MIGAVTTVLINGGPADSVFQESGPRFGGDLSESFNQDAKWLVRVPRHLIDAIESTRTHDVQLSVSVELRYFRTGAQPHETLGAAWAHLQAKVSQKEWLDCLQAMGYHGGWLLEVERPRAEGWPRAVEFLDRAADRIASRDSEGAIVQCRSVWESLAPLLDAAGSGIAAEVDRGSAPEKGEPPKSERITVLRKAVLKWSHAGAHPESYQASLDDALLAYRLTAALVSYLSRKAAQAEGHTVSSEKSS